MVLPKVRELPQRLRSGVPQASVSREETRRRVAASFDDYARDLLRRRRLRRGYHEELLRRYRFYVEPGASVLEIGVGCGDLLASLDAGRAVGVDISRGMLEAARISHPELELYELDAEDLSSLEGPFDYIILSDLTIHLHDVLEMLRGLGRLCHRRTRVVLNFHSRLWQPVFTVLSAMGLYHPHEMTNWLTTEDLANLLDLADFEVLKVDRSTLLPARIPLLSRLANDYLYRLWPIDKAGLVNWMVARPRLGPLEPSALSVSVICPARNEAGHIAEVVERTPAMGRSTELLFVEGHSTDDTWERIQAAIASPDRPDLRLAAYRQSGKGKGDAVRLGFGQASGDVLMILDADMTVAPETLPQFLVALASGKADFVNGSRLVYPMHDDAMRFLNIIGNKFFARLFSYILGQQLKDTLCGTKVLMREDYQRIARGRAYFGDFDPFGDFDLLFGASRLSMKIVEIPIRYRERVYGDTNIDRFGDGWLLFRMSWFGLRRLKFLV